MRAVFSLFILCLSVVATPAMALFGNSSSAPGFASDNNRFVPVDEAFPFNHFQQGNRIFLDWQVKADYYLYQERISVSAENVTIGELTMRDGQPHKDEFLVMCTSIPIHCLLKSH